MHDVSFEEALEFIQLVDPRYHREAYVFVREALDHTQERAEKDRRGRSHHVTGQELLEGIKQLGLQKFGPMAAMVFQEWGVKSCTDFGEIVFNMVELGGSPAFAAQDFKDLNRFVARLKEHPDPVSQLLWDSFSGATRQALLSVPASEHLPDLLAAELNRLLAGGPIYDEQRFAAIGFSKPAKCLVGNQLKGTHLARLNRLLLEDAYAGEITKAHGVLAKTEQDSRADFEDGYDFHDAFQRPFLPKHKQPTSTPTS